MINKHRREFLKLSGLSLIPTSVLFPLHTYAHEEKDDKPAKEPIIKFFGDGELYDPADYINILQKISETGNIEKDRYGIGGVVEKLEKKFTTITGKESAVFMPSGTMANQFAIAVLSNSRTKVFVQDLSHVYRDEADAAQSVFGKRLMPLAKGETYFTADMLKQAVTSLKDEEVFASGIGAVSIENPVRRADGRMMPVEEIKKISDYCREQNIGLHLDGARLFMASAWSGISIREYASYFDTVYISLYKYLGAAAGAVLCGNKKIIDTIPHLQKIHGGSMYGNWANAAVALYKLENIEAVLQKVIERATSLFAALNKQKGITVTSLDGGTNMYELKLAASVDGKKFHTSMRDNFYIRMGMPDTNNKVLITVNETLLYRDETFMVNAFEKSINNV